MSRTLNPLLDKIVCVKRHPDSSRLFGTFDVEQDRRIDGELLLAGPDTSLYVWSDKPLDANQLSRPTITGILSNLTKVSLVDFRKRPVFNQYNNWARYWFFPYYVVFGDRHFSHEDRNIHEISFALDDANALFHDTDAFGIISDNRQIMEKIIRLDKPDHEIEIGEWSQITYYTGKSNIFSSDTVLGQVYAHHSVSVSLSISANPEWKSDSLVNVKFDSKIGICEAVSRMKRVLRFFELMIGRAQNIPEIEILTGNDECPQISQVYVSEHPRHWRSRGNDLNFLNTLIDPVRDSEAFSSVLKAWLDRDETWRTARERLSKSWGERSYSYDRIIRAANVFDLLPKEVFGDGEPLPQEVKTAIRKAKEIFGELPESSIDQDEISSALGRATRPWPLRKKILHRVKSITEVTEHTGVFPEIEMVVNKAVGCRNLYVHGNDHRVTRELCDECLPFLTDTLEFVFVASDLVDMGWNIVGWFREGRTSGNPFFDYLVRYRDNLARLKELDPKSRTVNGA